jgi:hypothetical protein
MIGLLSVFLFLFCACSLQGRLGDSTNGLDLPGLFKRHPQSPFSVVMRLLAILSVVTGCMTAHAGDDRFGFATHFDQGWNPSTVMPLITPTGAAYIRDDTAWSGLEWKAQGVYQFYSSKLAWLQAAHNNGLKVVGCVQAGGPNATARYYSPSAAWYPNPYDVQGFANACAWLAVQTNTDGTPLLAAMEILNEPNNGFQSYEVSIGRGSYWLQDLTTFTNAAYAAIKKANPGMTVIGSGVQGDWIRQLINYGITLDGIVFHPYDLGSNIPETTYEWQYRDYQQFITAIRSWTKLPLWTTEQNISNGDEFAEAVWIARRLLLAFGLKVEHNFIYDFMDSSAQGVIYPTLKPKLVYYVLRDRLIPSLAGLSSIGSVVTVTAHDANWDATDFKNFVFNAGGLNPVVAAVWFGNHNTTTGRPNPSVATLSFPGTGSHTSGQTTVLDLITGSSTTVLEPGVPNPSNAPQWVSATGPIANITVSDTPILIIVQ